jgi:hypothetical protein
MRFKEYIAEATKCPKCGKKSADMHAQREGKHDFICGECEDKRRKRK